VPQLALFALDAAASAQSAAVLVLAAYAHAAEEKV
jgi:hypothetical protein